MDTSNWGEHFFEGLSVKLWLQAVSPEYTGSEAETIARLLGAAPPERDFCRWRFHAHTMGLHRWRGWRC